MKLPPPLLAALSVLRSAGGRPLLVGGCVRDWQLGLEPKDFDIEVYGLDYDALGRALGPFGPTDVVGRSFGFLTPESVFRLFQELIKPSCGHKKTGYHGPFFYVTEM